MTEVVLKDGFAVKKSGQKNLFGQYHWQKRWFILIQKSSLVTLSYYEKKTDKVPKGQVKLSNKYIIREPEADENEKPHLFAVGPLVEDGATRTYFISCECDEDKLEWMEVLNAAIEGASAETALKRRSRASVKFTAHAKLDRMCSLQTGAKEEMYKDPEWRKQQWEELVSIAGRTDWKKHDVKDGVTVSRMGFNENQHAIIKVEGIVDAKMRLVYGFLQKSLTQGGKLDFPFRKEKVLEKISCKPSCSIVDCFHEIRNLPRTRPRCATVLKMAMPNHMTSRETCGLLITSVNHSKSTPSVKEAVRISVGVTGCVLEPVLEPVPTAAASTSNMDDSDEDEMDTEPMKTKMTFIMQVNLQGSLQRIVKASYKSGLLVIGMRSFYLNLVEHINNYVKIVDI
ncbi:uncharacterized protein [Amphiura filiformis]|uniref:uncharacterized protein n=1 Tax=Amphiura filiformis TaxID=82378 RepID=UPI003B2182CE